MTTIRSFKRPFESTLLLNFSHMCRLITYYTFKDGHAVTRLQFLETRKGNSAAGGANLVSCGGNGWLRFWSTTHQTLLAEFVAHVQGQFPARLLVKLKCTLWQLVKLGSDPPRCKCDLIGLTLWKLKIAP